MSAGETIQSEARTRCPICKEPLDGTRYAWFEHLKERHDIDAQGADA